MVKKILTDLTALTQVCEKVPEDLVAQITTDLLETAVATKNCAGLAAPQIGYPYRAFVMKTPKGYLTAINPVITSKTGHLPGNEGCLSRPGVTVNVFRPHKITAVLEDKTVRFEGHLARVFAHELDHLNGKVIGVKRISNAA